MRTASRYSVGWILGLVYFYVVFNWSLCEAWAEGQEEEHWEKGFQEEECYPNGVTDGEMDGEKGSSCITKGLRLREAYLSGRIILILCQDSVLASCIFAP